MISTGGVLMPGSIHQDIPHYQHYFENRSDGGFYRKHLAGDTSCFRYPHMEAFEGAFTYREDLQYWQFSHGTGILGEYAEPLHKNVQDPDLLRRIGAEDITLYEFLVPEAKKIHAFDMAGVVSSEEAKQVAFEGVYKLYEEREDAFPTVKLQTVTLSGVPVRPGFQPVADLYWDLANVPVQMVTVETEKTGAMRGDSLPFPFGSMLKGTDLVFTDGNPLNFGQDLLHALYHLKEGIPGIQEDNLYVEEWWADVPSLYAMQLAKGRMARRKRLRPSPHPIHFTDYIYLRALLGQAFAPETEPAAALHPVFRVIEPSIRLMLYALANSNKIRSEEELIRILADAVLRDEMQGLTDSFETVFGPGSFEGIYDTYGIYEKLDRAARYADRKQLENIFFGGEALPDLLPPSSGTEDIERIWKDPAYRSEAVRGMICP